MAEVTEKLSNPKDIIGASKLPLHLWPATATAMGCLAFLEGALKYGRSNFRVVGVRSSIYKDALDRHMNAWFEGEEIDPESGLPHLAKALACIAIIIDAQAAGELNDDRMVNGGYHQLVKDLTPHVERLKAIHADKSPKHYTIQDNNPLPHPLEDTMKLFAKLMTPTQSGIPHHLTGKLGCYTTAEAVDKAKLKYLDPDTMTHEDAEGDPNYWGV